MINTDRLRLVRIMAFWRKYKMFGEIRILVQCPNALEDVAIIEIEGRSHNLNLFMLELRTAR